MGSGEISESSPEDVVERGRFWSVLSSEVGADSQEEHVKRAEVGSETISLALSESKDTPGGISSLLCLFLGFPGGKGPAASLEQCSCEWRKAERGGRAEPCSPQQRCTCGRGLWDLRSESRCPGSLELHGGVGVTC